MYAETPSGGEAASMAVSVNRYAVPSASESGWSTRLAPSSVVLASAASSTGGDGGRSALYSALAGCSCDVMGVAVHRSATADAFVATTTPSSVSFLLATTRGNSGAMDTAGGSAAPSATRGSTLTCERSHSKSVTRAAFRSASLLCSGQSGFLPLLLLLQASLDAQNNTLMMNALTVVDVLATRAPLLSDSVNV
jgi:hypothetical protein